MRYRDDKNGRDKCEKDQDTIQDRLQYEQLNMNRDDEEIKAILREARQRRKDERKRWRPFPF